jgi:hypothetical protein
MVSAACVTKLQSTAMHLYDYLFRCDDTIASFAELPTRTYKIHSTSISLIQGALSLSTSLRHIGRAAVQLHSFLTMALDAGQWSASRPGSFIPRGNSPWSPLEQEAGPIPQPVRKLWGDKKK